MRYSMAAASMAHTYGNVTCIINQWLLSLFPKEYFKTNYINSTIAYRDFATFNNNRKQFIKKQKPMLLVRPRIEIDVLDELPLNQTYFCNRIYDIMNEDIDTGNLQNFFYDKENNRQMQFLLNHLRINFDVTLVTETMMEQINLVHYFKNRVRQNYDLALNVSLESFISRDIMYTLAKDAGYEDVITKEGQDRMGEILTYVNSNSYYPVTVKYKNSSGKHEFFRFHHSRLFIAISGLDIDEGSKKNMVSDDYMINFTVRCDFKTAGLYVYSSENEDAFEGVLDDSTILDEHELMPVMTPQKIFSDKSLPEGWHYYTVPAFDIDSDERPYPLHFSALLNTSLEEAVDYHKKNGIPLSTFINIEILKNNRTMEIDRKEYEIDWENLIAYIYNCNIGQEYRFIMSVNTLYLNELLGDIVKYREEK